MEEVHVSEMADRIVAQGDVPGFTVTEERWERGGLLYAHVHEHPYVVVVFGGQFREHSTSGGRLIAKNVLSAYPAGHCHAVEFLEDTRLLSIEIVQPRCTWAAKHLGPAAFDRMLASASAQETAGRIREELRRGPKTDGIALEGLVLQLLAMSVPSASPEPEPSTISTVARARQLIESRFGGPLGVSDLSVALGVSVTHLSRRFRRVEGCSVGQYIRRRRVDRAIELLKQGGRPLEEIAAETGFCHVSHFLRAFKAETGATPSALRRRLGLRPRERGRTGEGRSSGEPRAVRFPEVL